MPPLAIIEVRHHTASGPRTRYDRHPILEQRADAVRIAAGWIDRALLTQIDGETNEP